MLASIARPSASTSNKIGNYFIERLGISVGEVIQRLVTDEILHEIDARHMHRLLAKNDSTARDIVMQLEQAGGSSSKEAVKHFRRQVINLFQEQLPQHIRPLAERAHCMPGNLKISPAVNPEIQLVSRELGYEQATTSTQPWGKTIVDAKVVSIPNLDVPVIENVSHHLAQRVAELYTTENNRPRVVLVGRGKYSPMHKMHLRHFVIARQHLEERTRFSVLGGLLVPKHATEVRQRCRARPQEIIPPRHRLAMARAAIGGSPWLTVDSWEITRRRMLDYLSTLDHIRQLFEQRFPNLAVPVRFVLLVAPDQLLRLNLDELKDAGHECITICRPQEHERLLTQMGTRWRSVAHVVEDNALLSAELESTSSSKLRQALVAGKVDQVYRKVPGSVVEHIRRHRIAEKMSGKERWTKWDKEFADGEVRFILSVINTKISQNRVRKIVGIDPTQGKLSKRALISSEYKGVGPFGVICPTGHVR